MALNIKRWLNITVSTATFVVGIVGLLLPKGAESDKVLLWTFVVEIFSWEFFALGIFGLGYVFITDNSLLRRKLLAELSILWNPKRNLLFGISRSALLTSRLLCTLVFLATLVVSGVLLWSIAWWTFAYIRAD